MALVRVEPHRGEARSGIRHCKDLSIRVDLREIGIEKAIELLDGHDRLQGHRAFSMFFAAAPVTGRPEAPRKPEIGLSSISPVRRGVERAATAAYHGSTVDMGENHGGCRFIQERRTERTVAT